MLAEIKQKNFYLEHVHEIVPWDLVQITIAERFHIGRAFADGEMLERILTKNIIFAEHRNQVVAGLEKSGLGKEKLWVPAGKHLLFI